MAPPAPAAHYCWKCCNVACVFVTGPLYFLDHNGEFDGLLRDLFDAFAEHAEITARYQPFTVPELFDAFLAGTIDIKLPDNPRWGRDRRAGLGISYSRPLLHMVDGVMVLSKNQGHSPTLLKHLGVIRGFTAVPFVHAIEAGTITKVEAADFDTLFTMLINGKVDGVYASVAIAQHYLENLSLEVLSQLPSDALDIRLDASLPHTGSDYHLSSLNRPELVSQFNNYLDQHREEVLAIFARRSLPASMLPAPPSAE